MNNEEKLQCAKEAAYALGCPNKYEGSTKAQVLWYRKWMKREEPTTAQMALSCFVAEGLWELIK